MNADKEKTSNQKELMKRESIKKEIKKIKTVTQIYSQDEINQKNFKEKIKFSSSKKNKTTKNKIRCKFYQKNN
jgi:hypothetical protein